MTAAQSSQLPEWISSEPDHGVHLLLSMAWLLSTGDIFEEAAHAVAVEAVGYDDPSIPRRLAQITELVANAEYFDADPVAAAAAWNAENADRITVFEYEAMRDQLRADAKAEAEALALTRPTLRSVS